MKAAAVGLAVAATLALGLAAVSAVFDGPIDHASTVGERLVAEAPDPTPVPSLGSVLPELSEDAAIREARAATAAPTEEVTGAVVGPFNEVFDAMSHRPDDVEQPSANVAVRVAPDQQTWAVQFRVRGTICGPAGGSCETRDGLRTVFLDANTGAPITTTTWSPAGGL